MRLESQPQLDAWLEQNHWLHDVCVTAISPLPGNTPLPAEVRITFELQVAGGYAAGDERTVRTIECAAHNLRTYSLHPEDWYPDHCSEGPEPIDVSDGVGFAIDVPGMLTIVAQHLEVLSSTDASDVVPAWLSDTEFNVTSSLRTPPTPAEWLGRFVQDGHDVVWRYYAGDERSSLQVPTDAYSGWFVQYRDRLGDHTGGLLFDCCSVRDDGYSINLRLNDPNCRELWITAGLFAASLPNATIRCGNATLSPADFESHLKSTLTRRAGGT